MPQCCYLAKGAKRLSHTTNTIKFDRIRFDPCNSIKRFDLCPFDQKNSTYLQPPSYSTHGLLVSADRSPNSGKIKQLSKNFAMGLKHQKKMNLSFLVHRAARNHKQTYRKRKLMNWKKLMELLKTRWGQGHFVTSHLGENMASITWATKVSTKWVDQIDQLTYIWRGFWSKE